MEKERINMLVENFIMNVMNNFEYHQDAAMIKKQFDETESFLKNLKLNEKSEEAIHELLNEKDITVKKVQILSLILDFYENQLGNKSNG